MLMESSERLSANNLLLEQCGRYSARNVPSQVVITKPVFKIGRDSKRVDLSFDSSSRPLMISRLHATISTDGDGRWKITDCQSVNGIYVNGVKVADAYLRDGDEIVFGEGGRCAMGSALAVANPEFRFCCRLPSSTTTTTTAITQGPPLPQEENQPKRQRELEEEENEEEGEKNEKENEKGETEREAKRPKKASISSETAELESKLAAAEALLVEHRRQIAEADHVRQQVEQKESIPDEEKQMAEEMRRLKASLEERERQMDDEKNRLRRELRRRDAELAAKAKEEKERRRDEEERRRQDMEETKRMLDDERKRLEAQHREREADLAREREALERQRAELESQIAQKRREIEAEAIQRTDLEEEFLCVICHSMMISPMTLECAHSFCSGCLDNWVAQKQACPMCRRSITRTPVRALNLDNIIEKIVKKMPEADKEEWQERAQKLKKMEEEIKQLQSLIESAKTRGLRFLVIWDDWTDEEQKIFADGVERYVGKPRVLYCSTVGLTSQFVESCSQPHLVTAARNLHLLNSPDVDRLRKNLLSFIYKNED